MSYGLWCSCSKSGVDDLQQAAALIAACRIALVINALALVVIGARVVWDRILR